MPEYKQAIVRPRVIVESRESPVLLEDLVDEFADAPHGTELQFYGVAGSGITTALGHIVDLFRRNPRLGFADQVWSEFALKHPAAVITFAPAVADSRVLKITCKMAPWDRDSWIEYLLAAHRERINSVMTRVQSDPLILSLGCHPFVSRLVMDELANDESLPNIAFTIDRITRRYFSDETIQGANGKIPWLKAQLNEWSEFNEKSNAFARANLSVEQIRLFRAYDIYHSLEIEAAWHDLCHEPLSAAFSKMWSSDLIDSLACRVAANEVVQKRLRGWINSKDTQVQPLAASLLHAAKIDWTPSSKRILGTRGSRTNLKRAILTDGCFSNTSFANCDLTGTFFDRSLMSRMKLEDVVASTASFSGANLESAELIRFQGARTCFTDANLSECKGVAGFFVRSDFSRANLTRSTFHGCDFRLANFSQADLRAAVLRYSQFPQSCIEGANFSDADLSYAKLDGLDLSVADFQNANFLHARMHACVLEHIELPGADFRYAELAGSLFTASFMPQANFSNANLCNAKLAEVEWEDADLAYADLSGATFHMGSSRSGLVGSSIPSFGSRTGFYTDELHEQDFKAPEEIRKANLRGADLRGAKIDGVDFYLVDLRDAKYDDAQEEQLIRTGAILENRVA